MRMQLIFVLLTFMSLTWAEYVYLTSGQQAFHDLEQGLSTEYDTQKMIEYLETQLERQRRTINDLEHMIEMIDNDLDYGEKLLKTSINLLFEKKHQEIKDKLKSEVPCKCMALIGPQGERGEQGREGEMGEHANNLYQGYQGRPGPKGPKGDKGRPGIDCEE